MSASNSAYSEQFDCRDFNLEKKIEALPSLSLEEFQAMKRQQRTKKKKILQKVGGGSKRLHHESSPEHFDGKMDIAKDTDKALLIGSQKRKARKQSITRNTLLTDSMVDEQQGPSKSEYFTLFTMLNILKQTVYQEKIQGIGSLETLNMFLNFFQVLKLYQNCINQNN